MGYSYYGDDNEYAEDGTERDMPREDGPDLDDDSIRIDVEEEV
jgi:hypothetical protein